MRGMCARILCGVWTTAMKEMGEAQQVHPFFLQCGPHSTSLRRRWATALSLDVRGARTSCASRGFWVCFLLAVYVTYKYITSSDAKRTQTDQYDQKKKRLQIRPQRKTFTASQPGLLAP